MPASDPIEEAVRPRSPDFDELRRRGRDLERALDRSSEEPDLLLDEARALLKSAKAAGAVAWLRRDRDQIDLAMTRAFDVYRAARRPVPEGLSKPDDFDETPADFDALTRQQALTRLLRDREIVGCRLEGIDLRELRSIRRAQFVDCVFVDCDLRGTDLSDAVMLHCVFAECQMDGVNLSGATASSCKFIGRGNADIGGGGFGAVSAVNGNFAASQFYNVTFDESFNGSGAVFSYGQVVRCVASPGASFRGARMDLTTIDDFDGRWAIFDDAAFIGAAFMNADLRNSSLRGANFSSARFASVDFRGATFSDRTWLKSAYFGSRHALDQHVYRFDAGVLDAKLSSQDRQRLSRWLAKQ